MKRVSLIYTAITFILTYPLIFRMNSSVYGFYDHITTDLFATMGNEHRDNR